MSKYIDADKLKTKVGWVGDEKTGRQFVDSVEKWLDMQPAEDVATVVHAEWKDNYNGTFTCSNCNGKASRGNYCPRCGAKMDVERKE